MELHENTEKQARALLVAVDRGSYDVEASVAELYDRLLKLLPVLVQVWFRKLQIFAKNRRLIC